MKKTLTSIAIVAALGFGASAHAVTISWTTNLEGDNGPFPAADAANNAAFGTLTGAADPDFRVMNGGAVSGGGEKAIAAGVTWTFDGAGAFTSVTGSDVTPGCTYYCTTNGGTSSANPAGDTGLLKAAPFLGKPFGFLAPTVGSAAAAAYGAGQLNHDGVSDAFSIFFPVLEAQWSGGIFTIGLSNGGVTFNCSGASTGSIECMAEQQIDGNDDTLGFAGQYTQWHMTGTTEAFASAVPVPAAVWLLGSGLLGLVGVARRRKAA